MKLMEIHEWKPFKKKAKTKTLMRLLWVPFKRRDILWPQLVAKLETCKKTAVQCAGLKSKQEGFIVLCLPWKISKAFKKEPEGAQQPFRNDSCLCIQRRWSCCGECLGGMG